MNYLNILLVCLLLWSSTTTNIGGVYGIDDDEPIVGQLSAEADIKKLSASDSPVAESKVVSSAATGSVAASQVNDNNKASAAVAVGNDGDTLETLQSQNSNDYNYMVSQSAPNSPINIDMGSYDSLATGAQLGLSAAAGDLTQSQTTYGQQLQHGGNGDDGESHRGGGGGPSSAPVVYRYSSSEDGGQQLQQQPHQQQLSYIRQEPPPPPEYQPYEPHKQNNGFPRMTTSFESDRGSMDTKVITPKAPNYRVPELPQAKPGISTTYSSPDVKIVSHTRSFLPVLYKKPVAEAGGDDGGNGGDGGGGGGQQAMNSAEQEYEKAVQDRPGGSYGGSGGGDADGGYGNDDNDDRQQHQQRPDGQSIVNSIGYDNNNSPFNIDNIRESEIVSRGPYYNIHKPFAAHIQVVEDKDDYRHDHKDQGYGGQSSSYGLRTQPRPLMKNYQPSGYQPGMISAYDPPSPPLSALLPSGPGQPYKSGGPSDNDNDDDDNDNDNDDNGQHQQQQEQQDNYGGQGGQGGLLRLPEPQPLQQQQSQIPYAKQQTPFGVEVEFDQNMKNEPQIIRGPGIGGGHQQQPQGYLQGLGGGNSGGGGQDYDGNNNHLGPKYNVGGGVGGDDDDDDSPTNGQSGDYSDRPPQPHQPHGDLVKPQAIQYGFVPLSDAKDIYGGGGNGGQQQQPSMRGPPSRPGFWRGPPRGRPSFGPNGGHRRPQMNGDTIGAMYGGLPPHQQSEGHRGGGYDGQDIYREPVGHGPGGPFQRKPMFDVRPSGGPQQQFDSYANNNGAKDVSSDESMGGGGLGLGDDMSGEDGGQPDYGSPQQSGPTIGGHHHHQHQHQQHHRGMPHLASGGLPPGASYNPRDVGLDESVVAQLNLAASSPAGSGIAPLPSSPSGYTGAAAAGGLRPFAASGFAGDGPVVSAAAPAGMPRPVGVGVGVGGGGRRPYSSSGQGFRSQYGYRAAAAAAAASELSPVSAPSGSVGSPESPMLSNILNLNPVKSFRSLMSYLTGGING